MTGVGRTPLDLAAPLDSQRHCAKRIDISGGYTSVSVENSHASCLPRRKQPPESVHCATTASRPQLGPQPCRASAQGLKTEHAPACAARRQCLARWRSALRRWSASRCPYACTCR